MTYQEGVLEERSQEPDQPRRRAVPEPRVGRALERVVHHAPRELPGVHGAGLELVAVHDVLDLGPGGEVARAWEVPAATVSKKSPSPSQVFFEACVWDDGLMDYVTCGELGGGLVLDQVGGYGAGDDLLYFAISFFPV